MRRNVLFLAVLASIFVACNQQEIEQQQSGIVRAWVNQQVTEDGSSVYYHYQSADVLGDMPGIQFFADGTLVERTFGECATPPITYVNYDGTWKQKANTITIEVAFWGGINYRVWEIVELSNTTLKVLRVQNKASFESNEISAK